MNLDLANINSMTEVLACTSTSASKTFGAGTFENTQNVNIYNAGPSPVFVTSTIGSTAAVYPTTSTGQAGTICPPNTTITLDKGVGENTINAICASGGTATIFIQFTNGI